MVDLTFKRDELRKFLAVLARATGSPRDPLYTQCVKVTWGKDTHVTLNATNLIVDIQIGLELIAPPSQEGVMLLQLSQLNPIVTSATTDVLTISHDFDTVKKQAKITAKAGKFKHEFMYINPDEFPEFSYDPDAMSGIAASSFIGSIQDMITFAAGSEAHAPHLQGIQVVASKGKIQAGAVDGLRLALAQTQSDCEVNVIIHRKAFDVLKEANKQGLFEDMVSVGEHENRFWVASTNQIIIGNRMLDGKFPDLARWSIPNGQTCQISKLDFEKTIKLLSNLDATEVLLSIQGQELIVASAHSANAIPISNTVHDTVKPATFNIDYVAKALAAAQDVGFSIVLGEPKDPLFLNSTVFDWKTLVMPIYEKEPK